jgi:hypothetical protein
MISSVSLSKMAVEFGLAMSDSPSRRPEREMPRDSRLGSAQLLNDGAGSSAARGMLHHAAVRMT